MAHLVGHLEGRVGPLPVSEIMSRGSIRGEDVARLAAEVLADGIIDAAEADLLIEMHDACGVQDAAWAPFFVDTLTDYIVHQAQPEGYINAVNARWLLSRIAPEGIVRSRAGLDLMVNVLSAARWAPVSLVRTALEQVLRAVRGGDGPLRSDRGAPAGIITPGEVALIRRILCAFGSDGNVSVTRAEAEVLCAIDAALARDTAEPCWIALFTSVIANVAMTASGYAVPTREAAFATIRSAAPPDSSPFEAYRPQSREDRALARLERQRVEIITNEEILGQESDWLADRLRAMTEAGGRVSPAMGAAISLLATRSCALDPGLQTALALARDKVSAAA